MKLPKSKVILFSLMTALLGFCVLEGSSLLYLLLKHDLNLWTEGHKVSKSLQDFESQAQSTKDANYSKEENIIRKATQVRKFSFNPLFGFHDFDPVYPSNNYLMVDHKDFPYQKKDPEELVIGIFGGSVACSLFLTIHNHEELLEDIKKILGRDKVTLLNFSVPAMSQPQQSMIMSLFIDSLDISINLDGHNEMIMKEKSILPIEFPLMSSSLMLKHEMETDSKDGKKFLSAMGKLNESKEKLLELSKDGLLKTLSSGSHLAFLIYFSMAKYQRKQVDHYSKELKELFDTKKNHFYTPEKRVQTWSKYIKNQNILAKAYGKKSFFFLQPNPFSKPNKVFSKEEEKYVHRGIADKKNRSLVYDIFEKEIFHLKEQGIQAYSLKDVFREIKETVYVDNCCHLNRFGEELVLKAIFREISKTLAKD